MLFRSISDMSTQILVQQLNKEVKTLQRDVTALKTLLLRILSLPEETLDEYQNASAIQKALLKAQKIFPRS